MRLRNIPAAVEAVAASPFCIQDPFSLKGQWNVSISDNKPIFIEVGTGKGQFLLQMASKNPDNYYVGLERYESVLYRALQKIPDPAPANISFLCQAAEDLENIFSADEVSGIYLNFSDPWPKKRHAKRRLTSSSFLDRYAHILKGDSSIEFKTDNRDLFLFSLEQIEAHPDFVLLAKTFDLHADSSLNNGNILTEYEEKFSAAGNPICKLIAQKKRV